MFKDKKRLTTFFYITTVILSILCIYLPKTVMPLRWLSLLLLLALLPVFIYIQREKSKLYLVALSVIYIIGCAFFALFNIDNSLWGMSTDTISTVLFAAIVINAVWQITQDKKNHKES